ncbi:MULTISPECIES: DUF3883 domain-containing protein [Shewanella]|uniref:DUF3883 domain-containing protein n=1 Tax=Shewanella marisflavi TaxID=260364 RepID=A0ABX5WNR3_9GAMM|nr:MULTISPECIES: DUF3883 domain-containing protein [Shewanella]QDF75265.1 DUF3883 domain-containing protein [Shewanella marisflavi]
MDSIKKQEILEYRKTKYQIEESSGACGLQSDVRRDLDNGVNILSEQLYSKELHFVFELIQNAEDNHYSDGVKPRLLFELLETDPTNTEGCSGCLAIYNNEVGFSIDNIKAISSVGSSTKSSSKDTGYIGEKGIGFKSVFAVSPAPHIFSNGYHFSFKDRDKLTGLGYIIPYPIDIIPYEIEGRLAEYTTCILLPVRSGNSEKAYQKIAKELKELDASILLFLNKLTAISVLVDGSLTHYEKSVEEKKTSVNVKRPNGVTTRRYHVEKRAVTVPKDLNEEKRAKVKCRDITLAFPLDHHSTKCRLYAYLPTELYTGLPFLVNADFLLPASREGVLVDKQWNLWMRDEISQFVYDSLSDLLVVDDTLQAFKWIPIADKCSSEFLLPVFEEVTEKLKELAFIPCVAGELRRPLECSIPDDGRQGISSIMERLVDNSCKVDEYIPSTLAIQFRAQIEPLCHIQFADNFCSIISAYAHTASSQLLKVDSSWFFELYTWFTKWEMDPSDINLLQAAPLLLTNNGVKSRSECKVFEAANISIQYPSLSTEDNSASFELLNPELQKLLTRAGSVNEYIKELFDISVLTQSEYLEQVALPFCKENLANIDTDQLWQLNRFVFQNWSSLTDDTKYELSSRLPLKLDDGSFLLNDEDEGLLTPETYEKSLVWQTVFSIEEQIVFSILSDDYMDLFNEFEKLDTEEVLSQLGAAYIPFSLCFSVSKSRYSSPDIPEGIFSNSYEKYLMGALDGLDSTEMIEQEVIVAPKLLRDPERFSDKSLVELFIQWLSEVIENNRSWKSQTIRYFYRSYQHEIIESEIWHLLKVLKWLPTNNGLKSIYEVFLPSTQAKENYGDALNYLEINLPDVLIDEFNLTADISSDSVLDVLRTWSSHNEEKDIKHMNRIYSHLAAISGDLSAVFSSEKLIYCPSGENNWCKASDAVWLSQKTVLGDVFHWLSDFYPADRQSFWLDTIGIQPRPSAEHFANAWLRIQESGILDPREQMELVYDNLLRYIRSTKPDERDPWFYDFVSEAKCLSQPYTNLEGKQQRSWFDCDDVFVSDIQERMRTAFSEEGIRFIWITRGRDHSDFEPLYDALSIRRASECIESDTSLDISDSDNPARTLLTDGTLRLLCYAKKNSKKTIDSEWFDDSLEMILTSHERIVLEPIEVDYTLDGHCVTFKPGAYFDRNLSTLFYLEDKDDPELSAEAVASELSLTMYKRDYRSQEDTVLNLLGADDKKVSRTIERKSWERLLTKKEIDQVENILAERNKNFDEANDIVSDPDHEQDDNIVHESSESTSSDDLNYAEDISAHSEKTESGEDIRSAHDVPKGHESSDFYSSDDIEEAEDRATQSKKVDSGEDRNPRTRAAGSHSHSGAASTQSHSSRSAGNISSSQSYSQGQRHYSGARENESRGQSSSPRDYSEGYRLLSYVSSEPMEGVDSEVSEDNVRKENKAIGDKAEKLVADKLRSEGYEVELLGGNNPGYDIEVLDTKTGELYFVEVKTNRGNWNNTGVGLSRTQYQMCLEHQDNYWLYVVECLTSEPIIHKIVNPASKINAYYFDRNWKAAADVQKSSTADYEAADLLDEECFQIFLETAKRELPEPEIGFDVQNEAGKIIASLELCWPSLKAGIYLDHESPEILGWRLASVSEVVSDMDWLDSLDTVSQGSV